jgi:hypothetical protein
LELQFYLNRVPQDLNTIYGRASKQTDSFDQCRSKQYESSPAYRVMEALRNYSQHCGLPVHAMIVKFEREDTTTGPLRRMGLQLFVGIQRLKEDGKFKKTVLPDLEPRANRLGYVNLTPVVREYIEKLCGLHESLRGRIATDVASWDQAILSELNRARQAFGENLSGLSVVKEERFDESQEEYVAVDSAEIFREAIDWRRQLEAKNRDFQNLSGRYTTGYATPAG